METEIMKKDETYNGWTNYETWNVALWIDNDEGLSEFVREQAQEFVNQDEVNKLTGHSMVCYNMAEWLKDYFDELNPLPNAGVFTDLFNAALSEVDWKSVAEHYLDGLTKEEE